MSRFQLKYEESKTNIDLVSHHSFKVPMAVSRVEPINQQLAGLELSKTEAADLIHYAQDNVLADSQLTIRQALKKYKKGVFWAMFLSTSLIMEGYDLVIVSSFTSLTKSCLTGNRSTHSMVNPNFPSALVTLTPTLGVIPFQPLGSLASQTRPL